MINIRTLAPLALLGAALLAGCATPQAPSAAAPVAAPVPLPTYADAEPLGAAMEGWKYPYPVQMLSFELEGRPVRMAYMDVQPAQPNGKTVVLFHGKNFGGDYWAGTLAALSAQGYRVIAPDQIGFGRSSKPEIKYTFAMLSDNTVRLLDHLKVGRAAVVANSMGGMLGVHFARRYPERVSALVLENPLGLEDYVKSIPPQQTANLVKLEMAQTPASYRNFVRGYFPTTYRPVSLELRRETLLHEMDCGAAKDPKRNLAGLRHVRALDARDAKVADLRFAHVAHQHVAGLDVAVHDVGRVDDVEGLESFLMNRLLWGLAAEVENPP